MAQRFARIFWLLLAATIGVILWGAYVRASGSGAGCGSHWPLCNGEVAIPTATKSLVELGHRATSGLVMFVVWGVSAWSFWVFPKGHPVRRGAVLSSLFYAGEALIGAGLVLFELVDQDKSMKRALSMTLHLSNTFFLLAAMVLTAFWASGGARVRFRKQGIALALVLVPTLALLFAGATGGIAALGDTLFPAASVKEGLAQDFSARSHLFLRLRVLHPFIACGAGVLVIFASTALRAVRTTRGVKVFSRVVSAVVVAQIAAGLLNVTLLAPIWMQLVHLVLADALWISLVLLGASALAAPSAAPAGALGEELLGDVALRGG